MKQQPSLRHMRSRYRAVDPSSTQATPRLIRAARCWPLVLAAMLALRALVPVGYMLSLPGDGSADWALHLCPMQNRSLDVSAFHALARGQQHAHSEPGEPSATGARTHLSVSGDCAVWLDSATPALATSLTLPVRDAVTGAPFVNPDLRVAGRLCRHPGQARAPPVIV